MEYQQEAVLEGDCLVHVTLETARAAWGGQCRGSDLAAAAV